ncbi:MAG: hypothetical protein RLY43_598 [Bacteroidota bacterium]|jgi:hypothetical protein
MTQECNIPTPCVNPLVFLLKEVFAKVSDGVSITASLDTILTAGIAITSSSNFCCPDCNSQNGFYYLGVLEKFQDLVSLAGLGNTAPTNNVDSNNNVPFDANCKYRCCVNYQLGIESKIGYNQMFKPTPEQLNLGMNFDKTPVCCSTDFTTSLQELLNYVASDNVVINGSLIEASTFNGKSGLGVLVKYLKSASPAISKVDLTNFFGYLLSEGLIVTCDGCTTYIMTVSQYNMYLMSKA